MLAVLSPAKKLNYDRNDDGKAKTLPMFQSDANRLVRIAKKLSVGELQKLMNISEDLAKLNKARFAAFGKESTAENAKQAMYAFAGDTYLGLDADQFDEDEQSYAQDHVRILSGLYGVLRPLDLVQPYRLEMGSRLENKQGTSLYAYWGKRLGKVLDEAAGDGPIVNLASTEYFKAAAEKSMKSKIITPAFKEERNGELKMIGFFAKRARGTMARFIVQNKIDKVESLKDFDLDGYKIRADLSDQFNLTFVRKAM